MMSTITAHYFKYILNFKKPSGTSRGILLEKETWFIVLKENEKWGIGECAILRGLSIDDRDDYEEKLKWVCNNINLGKDVLYNSLIEFPSIQFGIEVAFMSLHSHNPFLIYPSHFTNSTAGISINGLVWMGDKEDMIQQISEKIKQKFTCIKIKIGAIEFEKELEVLSYIREQYNQNQIEIRVDANGAFCEINALSKINQLAGYKLHSIEQPIKKENYDTMSEICLNTSLPIALDEELIGVLNFEDKQNLLEKICPQYLVLKPSLLGGFKGTLEWITLAEKKGIGWWITSALESNIGLNAIAQFTYTLQTIIPQGLGTGTLYTNNICSPLYIENGFLKYDKEKQWDLSLIKKYL